MIGPSAKTMLDCGAKLTAPILAGQWWRLVMPMFLHGGLIHLGINMMGTHACATSTYTHANPSFPLYRHSVYKHTRTQGCGTLVQTWSGTLARSGSAPCTSTYQQHTPSHSAAHRTAQKSSYRIMSASETYEYHQVPPGRPLRHPHLGYLRTKGD
jgi:hypothetical protein